MKTPVFEYKYFLAFGTACLPTLPDPSIPQSRREDKSVDPLRRADLPTRTRVDLLHIRQFGITRQVHDELHFSAGDVRPHPDTPILPAR